MTLNNAKDYINQESLELILINMDKMTKSYILNKINRKYDEETLKYLYKCPIELFRLPNI